MRMFILRSLIIIAVAVVVGDMASHAETLYGPAGPIPQAPIGHLQPRAPGFSARSAAEQDEQRAMSGIRRRTTKVRSGARQEAQHMPVLISRPPLVVIRARGRLNRDTLARA